MSRILSTVLVLSLVGCSSETAKKDASPGRKSAGSGSTRRAPAEPPKEVRPDSYPDVATALATVRDAAKNRSRMKEQVHARKWLIMQGARGVDQLGALFVDESADLELRVVSGQTLGQLGTMAEDPLIKGLSSPVARIRLISTEQLAVVQPTSPKIIAQLVSLVSDKDHMVRLKAINGLKRIGRPAASAIDVLQRILDDPQESDAIRRVAGDAMKKVNPRTTFKD